MSLLSCPRAWYPYRTANLNQPGHSVTCCGNTHPVFCPLYGTLPCHEYGWLHPATLLVKWTGRGGWRHCPEQLVIPANCESLRTLPVRRPAVFWARYEPRTFTAGHFTHTQHIPWSKGAWGKWSKISTRSADSVVELRDQLPVPAALPPIPPSLHKTVWSLWRKLPGPGREANRDPSTMQLVAKSLWRISSFTDGREQWGTVLEKLTVTQPVDKFPPYYGTWRRFITAFTTARHIRLSSATQTTFTHPHNRSLTIHFNIILLYTPSPITALFIKSWLLHCKYPSSFP